MKISNIKQSKQSCFIAIQQDVEDLVEVEYSDQMKEKEGYDS
jgi:hypothetical protein